MLKAIGHESKMLMDNARDGRVTAARVIRVSEHERWRAIAYFSLPPMLGKGSGAPFWMLWLALWLVPSTGRHCRQHPKSGDMIGQSFDLC